MGTSAKGRASTKKTRWTCDEVELSLIQMQGHYSVSLINQSSDDNI